MRIFYIGSSGILSLFPFRTLLASNHIICGLGVDWQTPASQLACKLPVITELRPHPLVNLAHEHEVAVIDLQQPPEDTTTMLLRLRPDLIVVSCYGARLASDMLGIPSQGAINCHPSLLPAYRGPAPIFWQYRHGVKTPGISIHRMTDRLDAGNILAQQSITVAGGLRIAAVNQRFAREMSRLLQTTLEDMPGSELVQDESIASYQGYPGAGDFALDTSWTVQHAFNFMRVTEHCAVPYRCEQSGYQYELKQALGYSHEGEQALPYDLPDVIEIEFADGKLAASCYH